MTGEALVCAEKSLQRIMDRQWWFTCPKSVRRVYSNVTQTPSIARRYLTLKGQTDLVELDVKTCQPLLLIHLLEEHCRILASPAKRTNLCTEIEQWRDSVLNRDVYEELARAFMVPEVEALFPSLKREYSREDMKTRLLMIFHSENGAPYPEIRAFEFLWPEITRFLQHAKRKHHGDLSIKLQRLEAAIMIDGVVPKLYTQGVPLLTIHDALIVARENCELAIDTVRGEFLDRIGLVPRIECKKLQNENALDCMVV